MPLLTPDPREEARLAPLPLPPPPAPPRTRASLDLAPLRRSRDLRLLIGGQGAAYGASTLAEVALPLQAYRLSHSTVVVGLLSLAEFVPLLFSSLLGGALADALDRRRLVLRAQLAMVLIAGALLANAALAPARLWLLFAAAAATGAAYGIQRPPLDAIVPLIVAPEELPAASSLLSVQSSVVMVAGPLLAGVLIAAAGLAAAYALAAALCVAALATFAGMRAVPPPAERALSLASFVEGARYARSRRDLLGTYLVDVNAMFFGIPQALMPAVAAHFGGPAVLGLLVAAAPAGALAVSLTSGWIGRVERYGRAIAIAALAWGLGIVVFGLAASLWLALAALAFAGGADMVSVLFRSTMWNESIPDRVRGRLAGIELLSYGSGPTLGNVEAGAAASIVGLRASIVAGGAVCVLGTAAICLAVPALWAYRAPAGRMLRAQEAGARAG